MPKRHIYTYRPTSMSILGPVSLCVDREVRLTSSKMVKKTGFSAKKNFSEVLSKHKKMAIWRISSGILSEILKRLSAMVIAGGLLEQKM